MVHILLPFFFIHPISSSFLVCSTLNTHKKRNNLSAQTNRYRENKRFTHQVNIRKLTDGVLCSQSHSFHVSLMKIEKILWMIDRNLKSKFFVYTFACRWKLYCSIYSESDDTYDRYYHRFIIRMYHRSIKFRWIMRLLPFLLIVTSKTSLNKNKKWHPLKNSVIGRTNPSIAHRTMNLHAMPINDPSYIVHTLSICFFFSVSEKNY